VDEGYDRLQHSVGSIRIPPVNPENATLGYTHQDGLVFMNVDAPRSTQPEEFQSAGQQRPIRLARAAFS
jgi:hypothetical protein